MTKIVPVSELVVGMRVVESVDGYLLDVRKVERVGNVVTVTVGSDFSPDRNTREGITINALAHHTVEVFEAS